VLFFRCPEYARAAAPTFRQETTVTYRPAPVPPGAAPVRAIPARLEPDAIGVTQDVVIGTANAAPAVAVALTLAPLAAAAAYGSGPVILVCGAPMLIIANSYRRLNLWKANCGASFEWVGHAISPYLGFLTGWLMIAGNLIGTTASTAVLGPSVLAVAGQNTTSTWPDIAISTAVILGMLVIAVAGIRITARTQVGMAAIEYAIPASPSRVSRRSSAITTVPSRSPRAGSASAGSAGRAAWHRVCCSRCSCIPAGTPPCT